jgi:hypothetical protein
MASLARRLGGIAIGAVITTGCIAPVPPPSRTSAPSGPPALAPSEQPASFEPSEAPGEGPTGAIVARIGHGVTAVGADGSDAWYVRDEGPEGRTGHATLDGGPPFEAPAGPVPVAIAAGSRAVYVLEGVPDDAPRKGLPRTGVLEKLDRRTLEVLASARIPGLPVDVKVDGERVWVGGVSGWIGSFDAETLEVLTATTLAGDGSSFLAIGGGSVWVMNGVAERHVFLVHRLDPASGRELSTWNVPGSGVLGTFAVGARVWIAGFTPEIDFRLTPVSLTGEVGVPLAVRPIAAMRAAGGSLWVLPKAPADLVRYDEASLGGTQPVRVGDVGQDLAVSGTHVWAASEDLVALTTTP